jgi:hypothetical protein
MNALGERFDELKAQEKGDEQFARLTAFLNEPDPRSSTRPRRQRRRQADAGEGAAGRRRAVHRVRRLEGVQRARREGHPVAVPVASVFGAGRRDRRDPGPA